MVPESHVGLELNGKIRVMMTNKPFQFYETVRNLSIFTTLTKQKKPKIRVNVRGCEGCG